MSIRPFSANEIDNLREVIEQNGFRLNGLIKDYFRYSISKNKILIFTLKIPVHLPVNLTIPFEVANFQISIAFRFFHLNQEMYRFILSLMNLLKDLSLEVSIEHKFPIQGKERQLVDVLNLVIPEVVKEENDRAWMNRIRISIMNKRERFKEFDNIKIKDISEALIKSGLSPTFKVPWELIKGLPKLRTAETLFYSTEEPEFFVLEKGYFTYFKDLEYEKFYLRTFYESYTPYLLNEIFDNPNFKLEVLVETWIKFARLLLNSAIEIIDTIEINQNEFINLRPQKTLDSNNFEFERNNFPLSALYYECTTSKELYTLHNDLFNTPPTSFEVIEYVNYLTEAESLRKNYKFQEASKILEDSLKIFNKYRQKKIVVSILLQLRKIASYLNQNNAEINYLKNALEIAKSGEVPLHFVIRIHYKLGKTYFKLKDYNNALKHFLIILNFLKEERKLFNKIEYEGLASLYTGISYLELNKIPDSQIFLKDAFQIGNKSPKVKLKYHLLRGIYYKDKEKYSQAQKLFKTAVSGNEINDSQYQNILLDLLLEIGEFHIHYRKDTKKAFYNLELASKFLSKKTLSGLKRSLRWTLLMGDFYKILINDSEKSSYYLGQSRIIRSQLNTIGVID
jgi:tetratricopeptide (TPR) repeat protein